MIFLFWNVYFISSLTIGDLLQDAKQNKDNYSIIYYGDSFKNEIENFSSNQGLSLNQENKSIILFNIGEEFNYKGYSISSSFSYIKILQMNNKSSLLVHLVPSSLENNLTRVGEQLYFVLNYLINSSINPINSDYFVLYKTNVLNVQKNYCNGFTNTGIYKKGVYKNEGITIEDSCVNNTLLEVVCYNGEIVLEQVNCSCSNGICADNQNKVISLINIIKKLAVGDYTKNIDSAKFMIKSWIISY